MARRSLLVVLLLFGTLAACGAGSGGDRSTTTSPPAAPPPARTAAVPAPQARPSALLRLFRVGTFRSPLYVTAPPGDLHRTFVVEQGGRIRLIRFGRVLFTPFLDISNLVLSGGEQGLLSIAFAPDYATTGRFYVYFVDRGGNERVVEYRRLTLDRANPRTARTVLFMRDFESNHNGGQLQFGPDRLLYIGTGDGGGANDRHGVRGNAQSLTSLLGKILRIDPRALYRPYRAYRIPITNPFARRVGVRREIYAYGLRNPWRFSFDRLTGAMVIGDVGQSAVEEIDFAGPGLAAGRNYGWRAWEGRSHNYPDENPFQPVFPVFSYTHASGGCSITGGYVIRDRALVGYYGRYVYGDFCDGRVHSLLLGPPARFDATAAPRVSQLSSFGEDAAGHVYATSLAGPVYRLAR